MVAQRVALPIQKDAEEPIYRQLIRLMRDRIIDGTWGPGSRLPASRDLAQDLGISRISVVNAYAELHEMGLVSGQAGRGTFVTDIGDTNDPRDLPSVAANPLAHVLQRHPPDVIAFSGGAPAEEFLPVEAIRRSMNAVFERDGAAAVAYEDTEGYFPLRQAVSSYLSRFGISARSENTLITGGCQQALDLAVQAMTSEGDTLVTTNPTYLGILDLARVRRIHVVGVPMDHDGIQLDALEVAIQTHRTKLIYIAPTYHNPTGQVMSIHRRRQLLNLALQYDVPILEDGVYHEFSYGAEPPPPLKALDEHGIVLHASGFSKIVLPGTRIGYLIAESNWWERLLRVKRAADICTPSLNQRTMQHYLGTGALQGHLDWVRRVCRERRDIMQQAMRRMMPPGTLWNEPTGSMYLWVQLPTTGPSANELYASAIKFGVTFAMGAMFHTDNSGSHYMRLNFTAQPPDRIEEGIRRLRLAYDAVKTSTDQIVPAHGYPIL